MISSVWKNRNLLYQFTLRDISSRYRGSLLGILWSFLTPLMMLAVYTFVFGVVFQARWEGAIQNKSQFALVIFCGLLCFNIFAESVGRAPTSLASNPNYVKKVVFPIEIIPVTLVLSSLVNALIALVVLMIAELYVTGSVPPTILIFPLVILPLLLVSLGVSWFLASLGVYIKDVVHIVPVVISALMFLSPIFYPLSAIPEKVRFLFLMNPLGNIIENTRRIAVLGTQPDWIWVALSTLSGSIVCIGGYIWFQKTRKGFADVI